MKKVFVLLLVSMLLVGCVSEPSESTTPESVASQTESSGQSASSTQSGNGGGTNADASEEKTYVLSFEAKTTDGNAFSSEIFSESKVTMINVWATYCNPCLEEMPDLGEIAQEYDKSDFQLIGIISDVVEDAPQSDIDAAKDLIAQTEANYPHLLLNQSLFENLVGGVSSVPTTFFVNSKGEVLGYVVGANDKDTWLDIINDLLSKEGDGDE